MGSVIGRNGLKIKAIQDSSGARMVASKDMLPQSTERIVEVQGSSESIGRAIEEIGRALEHLADDGEALGGVCTEDGRWGEGIADEGEFPSEVELVRDGRLW